jgi:hypothetical protein
MGGSIEQFKSLPRLAQKLTFELSWSSTTLGQSMTRVRLVAAAKRNASSWRSWALHLHVLSNRELRRGWNCTSCN